MFMRHKLEPGRGDWISSLSYECPPDMKIPEHSHETDQLVYATTGVMEVTVGQSFWLLPPQFALWMPAGTRHKIRMSGAVSMRTLYLQPGTADKMPEDCTVIHVAPLLRELIVEAVRLGRLRCRNGLHAALKTVLVANLHSATSVPTKLCLPEESRAASIARATLADPAAPRTFKALCEEAGASTRTIERIFQRELGMTFETWRRQARLMKAIELLERGFSVKEAAHRVGYRQPGSFVTIFRDTLGRTPKAWVSSLRKSG